MINNLLMPACELTKKISNILVLYQILLIFAQKYTEMKIKEIQYISPDLFAPKDAWDKLSMAEKSEMMKVAVRNGITNLQDIRAKYNEFAEGGDTKHPVTTGGTGYIPENNIDIKKRLYDNVTPFGYNNPVERIASAVFLNKPSNKQEHAGNRDILDDLWGTYLGIPRDKRHYDPVLTKSKYRPTKEKDTNTTYYSIPYSNEDKDYIIKEALWDNGETKQLLNPELGTFTVSQDRDSKGQYVSYYDNWNLNPFKGITNVGNKLTSFLGLDKIEDLSLGLGNPVEIYDRIYLDDYYGVPKENRGGTYLPEVTVYGRKHSDGGSIHIKPENRGKFTALKERTGHSATWFKEHGTPAQKKMATFALNSRHWKHGEGGNLFDGKSQPTQQMQFGTAYWQNQTQEPTFTEKLAEYNRQQEIEKQKKLAQFRQAINTKGKALIEQRAKEYLTTSNDNTWIENRDSRVQAIRKKNPHLAQRAEEGAKAHRAWEEEHPIAAAWGNVLGAVPLAVASYPFVTGAVVPGVTALGDAVAATTAGKALTSALTPIATATTTKLAGVPTLEWADAGLQSLMAVHGLNTAVKEGGVSPTTALELSPLVPPTIGIGNNLYLPHLREHIYASKAPIGYDGIIKASRRIAEGVLSGKRADIENPFWFNPKSAEALQGYAFVPSSIQGGKREQYLKDFGKRALKARADIWRMYNRLPQKYNTFVESEKFPGTYTAPDDIKALHWVPQPRENIDPGDFVNSVGGNVGLPEITNLGRGIPEPGYSSKEFGVTTLTDLWDLHPFSRPGDRLISRLKKQWNSSTYKAANAIRKVVGSKYIKDGSGTYIPVPNSHTYITKLEDVDLFDTGASIGQVQSTSPTLVSKAPSKIAQRTANKILKLADKVENIKAPNFTILKPIDNKLAKFEIGRLFGGKPVLIKNEIPWTMDRKFIDTEGNIGFQSSWTQGFNSTNILPQSVIDWKRGYSPALLEEPNINPDIFKYLTR